MPIVTSAEEAAANSRLIQVNGREYRLDEYIGQSPTRGTYVPGNEVNDDGRPQGFLVHQPPNAITPAHFHEPNQFQVFVGGGGRIGAQTAAPLTVQYANGHTPYGPIVAGDQGVEYFTLRQRWDPGAKYLPKSNDLLRAGNQRRRLKGGIGVEDDAGRRQRQEPACETVLPAEGDGLASWIWRMGSKQHTILPPPAGGGGQYLIVVAGTLEIEGRSLGRLSTVFITPDDPAFAVKSGPDGLDLLVLQFPRPGETLTGPVRKS